MKVGFIGVGNMGGPMCRNIIRNTNHEVIVFDLSAGALKECTDLGAWDEKAGEKAFENSMKTIDAAMKHPSGRLSAMAGPAQIDTCREGFFKEALQEAKKRGIPMQTHADRKSVV